MLFPFGAVNDPKSPVAAAAGGCMLVRRAALERAGGLAAIRHNIIDDCALGRAMKSQGPIWLGLTNRAVSLRPYEHLSDIGHMVTRTAYAQLGYSPLVLAGTLVGPGDGLSLAGDDRFVRLGHLADGRMDRLDHHGGDVPADLAFLPPVAALGAGTAFDRRRLCRLHVPIRHSALVGQGRHVEGPGPRRPRTPESRHEHDASNKGVAQLQSGKGHTDENFPVASVLIAPQYRPPVMAFYKFVRAADDVADNASAPPEEKLALLEQMRASLVGESDFVPEGVALRTILAERGLDPDHALDLLEAFRRDCTKLRYRDWDDLIDYCRYSAMPVGRFVLDVHGESRELWPANDALCAALQVINHLQDCAKDYRELDRVYIPSLCWPRLGSVWRRWRKTAQTGPCRRLSRAWRDAMRHCWRLRAPSRVG